MLRKFIRGKSKYKSIDDILTPLAEAVSISEKRQSNAKLKKRVESFLNGDIPEHFADKEIIFYLARHVATPNYEALRFIEITKPYNKPTVIGQDPKDKFVSNNTMKRALAKLPVTKGTARKGDEIVENYTFVDFSLNQGLPLKEVKTVHGHDLIQFHADLFMQIYPTGVVIVDESDWIDRNHRGDLINHYVKFLSLLILHGIMVESYIKEDAKFIEKILIPAFETVEKKFGVRPLISPLLEPEILYTKNWDGYPSVLYQFIQNIYINGKTDGTSTL